MCIATRSGGDGALKRQDLGNHVSETIGVFPLPEADQKKMLGI
jgi:hypothetical protein